MTHLSKWIGAGLCLLVALWAITLTTQPSSRAPERAETDARVLAIGRAITYYRDATGGFPTPDPRTLIRQLGQTSLTYCCDRARVEKACLLDPPIPVSDSGMPLDGWGRPMVIRISGNCEAIRLESVGRNGIDNNGGGDDIHYVWTNGVVLPR